MCARQRLIAFVIAALPSATMAQGFEYAPGTQQFRVTQTTKGKQEAMGQTQELESTGLQLFTLTLSRQSRDTLAMAVVLDSVAQTGPMGPTPGLDRLKGAKLDAKLSPNGALYSASAKDSTVAGVADLAQAAGNFLPRIRSRLAMGATWMDTVNRKMRQAGIEVDRRTISRFSVTGDTTVAGEKSWKVARKDSTTISGTGSTQGQALSMEGTALGDATLFVSQRGAFVGGAGTEKADIKIVLAANGIEVKVVQTAETKIEKVK